MKKAKSQNNALVLTGIMATLFTVVAIWAKTGNLTGFNRAIYETIAPLINPMLTTIAIGANYLGKWYVWLLIAIGLALWPKTRRKIGYLAVSATLSAEVLEVFLKSLIAIPRPEGHWLVQAHGYGFPSGHATVAAAFIAVLIFWLWRSKLSQTVKTLLTALAALSLLFIGFCRIYLGVHNFTDVLGGYLLGIFVACAIIKLLGKRKP
jgi:undecaprenyl-diphosphatase